MLTASLLLTAAPCKAGDSEFSRKSLRGLSGVHVLVENLTDDAKRVGLDTDTIQTDVELKLRLAGITVLTSEESLRAPGMPDLYVNVDVMAFNGFYVYSVTVEVDQNVMLRRNYDSVIGAATWSVTGVGGATSQSAKSGGREFLSELIDHFLNAYLDANPKK
jgi:hypothetical protein